MKNGSNIVLLIFYLCPIICSCLSTQTKSDFTTSHVCNFVDPLIGTKGEGHCAPVASVPFGMIQTGPQTGLWGWDYVAGYQYADSLIYGFSQTRLSGTGCPDLGDLLVLPFTGDVRKDVLASSFDKNSEISSPEFYSVHLNDFNVDAMMTASGHVAFHQYHYGADEECRLLIDFQNGITWNPGGLCRHIKESSQTVDSPSRITGYARSREWVDRWYYYVIEFDKSILSKTVLPQRDEHEKAPRWILNFGHLEKGDLKMKISLSSTGIQGAVDNMKAEIPDWNFESARAKAGCSWEKLLHRITAEGTEEQKRIFYTALYHCFIQPNNIADNSSAPMYSTFSFWDTYRAVHPLYTIVSPEWVNAFINSMLNFFDQNGFLPIWSLWGKENYCMIGNHAVPVIVDAYLKGFRGFDQRRAYNAIKTTLTANLPKSDSRIYDKYGYYPFDMVRQESVSRTLECSYDDYCAFLMAKELGLDKDAAAFKHRSDYYRNVFDSSSKFMRGKDSRGNWRVPFDPLQYSSAKFPDRDYTESIAWAYLWHVQHDVEGLVDLMGGKTSFERKLDEFFSSSEAPSDYKYNWGEYGYVGLYNHANEPAHHSPYLYSLIGTPHKAERLVHYICNAKYHDTPQGLCGNDDCGQLSAWYVFSALGFYPVNPCGGEYVLGAPQIPSATIHLASGRKFEIRAENYSPANIYVDRIELNGEVLNSPVITHENIMSGGSLIFHMKNTDKTED